MTKFDWPLMSNNINQVDKRALIRFIRQSDKFTNGSKVKNFEPFNFYSSQHDYLNKFSLMTQHIKIQPAS